MPKSVLVTVALLVTILVPHSGIMAAQSSISGISDRYFLTVPPYWRTENSTAREKKAIKVMLSKTKADPSLVFHVTGHTDSLGSELAVKPLMEVLESDPGPIVRSLAAVAIGQLKHPSSRNILARSLVFDSSETVRYRSAEALARFEKSNSSRLAYLDGIKDIDRRVRYVSLKSLSPMMRKEDIPALIDLLADEAESIRDLAHQVLGKTGLVMEKVGDRYRVVK